jgi:endonuclease/exonuclease/phosphatase family metal-dependent hydrolase
MRLKVLSYNIHKGFNTLGTEFMLHGLKDAIRETGAHVLFLQEVVGENHTLKDKHSNWPTQPQFEFLADSVWQHYSYGKNAVFSGRHHGNAILSQFPIATNYNLNISNNRWEQRGLLHCQIQFPDSGKSLELFNTHIDLLAHSRKKQLKKISHYIQQVTTATMPLLFAGDFNDWTHELTPIIAEDLKVQDTFMHLYQKPARSFPHFFPILPLDRIYFRGVQPVSAQVLRTQPWSHLSDHLPLLAEFEIY